MIAAVVQRGHFVMSYGIRIAVRYGCMSPQKLSFTSRAIAKTTTCSASVSSSAPARDWRRNRQGWTPKTWNWRGLAIYPSSSQEIIRQEAHLLKQLPQADLFFFDSRTHPLGDASLRVG